MFGGWVRRTCRELPQQAHGACYTHKCSLAERGAQQHLRSLQDSLVRLQTAWHAMGFISGPDLEVSRY